MRSTFLARCLRALPVCGFAVLLVLGVAQTMTESTPVAAESVTHTPTPRLRLTVVVGLVPVPVVLALPVD